MVIALMAGGTTVIAATPASAVPGGCNGWNPVSACIDWGYYNNRVRADFYMNRAPDSSYYRYEVFINVNGNHYLVGSGPMDHTGRYCCWYRPTDSLPNIWYTVYSQIDVYTSWGALHIRSTSPTIRYIN